MSRALSRRWRVPAHIANPDLKTGTYLLAVHMAHIQHTLGMRHDLYLGYVRILIRGAFP